MSRPRILCVSDEYPWPATTGYRLRLTNVLAALASAGTVDLFCSVAERPDLAEGEAPPPPGVDRLYVHCRDRFRPTPAGIVRWARSRLPRAVAWIDWRDADRVLAGWAPPGYDLVWVSHCHTWAGIPRSAGETTVVDFDNLEDVKLRLLLALRQLRRVERPSRGRAAARDRVAAWLDRRDVGRWTALQAAAADASAAVLVCSELDRDRLPAANAVVVPNGYADRPVVRGAAGPPVLTMVGLMIYPPNEDGARFFATRVLPLVRAKLPEVVLRIVGREDGLLADLTALDGVEVVGEVDDVAPYLAEATAAVVPLRAGSGTRVKILEAFAARVPVVSTSVGCEGIGARDGIELLVADTPEELARACVRVGTEPELAERLAAAGHVLWSSRYRWDHVRERVRELVDDLSAGRD